MVASFSLWKIGLTKFLDNVSAQLSITINEFRLCEYEQLKLIRVTLGRNMLDKGQKQNVGDNSTVVQGAGDVVLNVGLSYADARDIAQDVAKATFSSLRVRRERP